MKKLVAVLVLILLLLTISGCWDNKDVTEISIISAIGLDKGEDGSLEVTFRISKPTQGQAGGGEQSGGEVKSFTLLTVKSDTLMDAINDAHTTISRDFYLAHMQLLVIGEELARTESIRDILDLLERDREANVQSRILISRGIKAKTVLEAHSDVEYISIIHLTNILKNSPKVAKMRDVELIDVYREKTTEGSEPFFSIVQLSKDSEGGSDKSSIKMEDLRVAGVGIFKQGKMIGSLDPTQTWATLFVEGECQGGVITIPNPLVQDKVVTIKINRSRSKKSVKVMGEKDPTSPQESLSLSVEVNAQGNIAHQQGAGDLTSEDMVEILETEVARIIRQDIERVIEITQTEYITDIFGFGSIVHRRHLTYWKNIQDWNETYSELPIEVDVDFELKGSGYINKPMESR